jgi:hypothetical protein
MPEGLTRPDGTPVDVDAAERQFAAAMAAPPADADAPAPPKRPPREAQAGEQPRRRGRPPKSERARTDEGKAPAASAADQEALTARRTANVRETTEMVAGACLVASKITGSPPFKADAYVIQGMAEPIGKACAEVARHDPAFARFIDKSGGGKVTAYLGLATVALALGSQLAANHGIIKPGIFNTHAPADIIAAYEKPEAEPNGDETQPE